MTSSWHCSRPHGDDPVKRIDLTTMARGFRSDTVSRTAGVAETFIERILKGTTDLSTEEPCLQKLADTLDVTVAWLLEDDESERILWTVADEQAAMHREMHAEIHSLKKRLAGVRSLTAR